MAARPEHKSKHPRKKPDRGHDGDEKKHKKKKPPPGKKPPPPPTTTEQLKELSTQSGPDAMMATPNTTPAEPANAEAVYTTGPGQAVEYNYTRLGTYADEYAAQSNQAMAPVPAISGSGQPPAMGFPPVSGGAANNPT